MKRSSPSMTGAALLIALVLGSLPAQGANHWKNGVAAGNWGVSNNWSASSAAGLDNAGAPTAGEAVYIAFTDGAARTVTYDVAAPSIGLLDIDLTGPGATTATLLLPGTNNLTTDGIIVGGSNSVALTSGRGALVQSGGTVTTSPSVGDVVLGYGAGSTGVYTLNGGSLINYLHEYIGLSGAGTFNQSGGSNFIDASASGFLSVGHNVGSTGTYNLSGNGSLVVNATEYVGNAGTGVFNQSGGTHSVTGTAHAFYMGYVAGSVGGAYALSGGTLSMGTFISEYIGYNAPATFTHTGGTNRFLGASVDLSLGANSGGIGTYELSGTGSLLGAGAGRQQLGFNGVGVFNQTGGVNSGFGSLEIGGNAAGAGSGVYTLSGGSATFTGSVAVGGSTGPVTGILNVSDAGVLNIGSVLNVKNTPGASVNLSGGTIKTLDLNLNGVPSLLNWTGGTLNFASNVVWDSSAPNTSTSNAFGPSLALGANQTLMISGYEHLGGVGPFELTLNAGSTHRVATSISINPAGTLTQNAGSTLFATAIAQLGGTVNGTLQNQGTFVYQSGQFNGRLRNQGTVSFDVSFTAGNGVENDAAMSLAAGQTLIVNGAGLDNLGTFTLAGGAISGSGPVLNNHGGTLAGYGTIDSALTNDGVLEIDGVLRLNGASNANNGIVRGSGTVIGALANAAGGTLAVGSGELLAISNAWTNSGLATLSGGGVLGGGAIANSGTIQGAGTITAPIANAGVIRAAGGELDLGAAGIANSSGGLIQAATGNTVMVLQGLAANAGTIALTGGAFDNNNRPLTNAGVINGYGVVRTSALTNANKLNVGEGNLDVFGAVTNNGTIGVQGGRSIYFFGAVNGPGSYTGTGTAVFLAAVAPGNSPAAVSFGGNATLASTSTLLVELGGTIRGSEYDAILAAGNLTLGGALAVSFIDAGDGLFAPAAGDSFDLLDWGSLSGSFASISLPTLNGLQWDTTQLYSHGVVSVVSPYLEADFNENGAVDAVDFGLWKGRFGTAAGATHLQGDANGDHAVDGGDFLAWQRQRGSSTPVPPSAAVPEPSTALLAVLLATLGLGNRRAAQEDCKVPNCHPEVGRRV